jgi:hypothetical protein
MECVEDGSLILNDYRLSLIVFHRMMSFKFEPFLIYFVKIIEVYWITY